MTREEAIERLKTDIYKYADFTENPNEDEFWTALDMAIEVLEQTRWIPVSEKLPEVNQKVLVTSYGRVCYAMMTSVDGNSGYPIFRLQDSLNEKVVCETTVHSEYTTSRITAWMPLPEPYHEVVGNPDRLNGGAEE